MYDEGTVVISNENFYCVSEAANLMHEGGNANPSTYFMVCTLSSVFPYYLTEFVLQSCEAGIRNVIVSVLEIGELGDFPKVNGCPSYQISRLLFLCCPSCHCPSACWNVLEKGAPRSYLLGK